MDIDFDGKMIKVFNDINEDWCAYIAEIPDIHAYGVSIEEAINNLRKVYNEEYK